MKNTQSPLALNELLGSPCLRISAERIAEQIAELEAERRWYFAEIESVEAAIRHHCRSVRSIEGQIDALKKETV